MHATTRATLKADKEIPADRREAAIQFLDGRGAMPLPRLLVSQAEAARLLGCSRITVWRMVQDGELHPVNIRGARRYRFADLQALADGGR